jgi:hypothetical protein
VLGRIVGSRIQVLGHKDLSSVLVKNLINRREK